MSQVENEKVMVFTLDGVSNSEITGNRMANEYDVRFWNPVVCYVRTYKRIVLVDINVLYAVMSIFVRIEWKVAYEWDLC